MSHGQTVHTISSTGAYFNGGGGGITASPGDTIRLLPGMYTGLLFFSGFGDRDNPVHIDGNNQVLDANNAQHAINLLRDVNDTSGYYHIFNFDTIKNAATSIIDGRNAYGVWVDGLTFRDVSDPMTVHDGGFAGIRLGFEFAEADSTRHRSYFSADSTYAIVNHVHLFDVDGEGIYINSTNQFRWDYSPTYDTVFQYPQLQYVRINNCKVWQTGWDAFQFSGLETEVYNNEAYEYGLLNVSPHVVGYQLSPGGAGLIYNNIAHHGENGAGFQLQGTDYILFNNIVFKAPHGIYLFDADIPTPNGRGLIYNNSFLEITTTGIYAFSPYKNKIEIENNILAMTSEPDNLTSWYIRTGGGTTYDSTKNEYGHSSAFWQSLNLSDSATLDFRPRTGSLLINAGKNLPNYSNLLNEDYNGQSRTVFNNNWDVGAIEN